MTSAVSVRLRPRLFGLADRETLQGGAAARSRRTGRERAGRVQRVSLAVAAVGRDALALHTTPDEAVARLDRELREIVRDR